MRSHKINFANRGVEPLNAGPTCVLDGTKTSLSRRNIKDSASGEFFSVWSCPMCGLGATVPSPEDIANYYPVSYHGDRHGFSGYFANRRRLRYLRKSVGAANGRRLIDIGCGSGSFLKAAAKAEWVVSGTELNPDDVHLRGLRVESSLEALADVAPVDVVTLWHSLEHIPNPPAMIRSVKSVLRPSGTVIVAVPNFNSLQSRLTKSNWLHLDVPRHLNHFSKESITALLEESNFEILRFWNLELEYDLVGWSQSLMKPFTGGRTIFFDVLTKQSLLSSRTSKFANLAIGSVLSTCALPIIPFTSITNRGAVLVVAARMKA
jgi:SAM-dependent methyltransferase